jgi:D-3-phosphoglycerate dehydrogenase
MIGLISDKVTNYLITLLKKNGYRFDYIPEIERGDLLSIIENYEYIIVRGRTKIDKEIIDKARKLKLIIRFGVGLDNIDVPYANEKGIKVFNTPSAFTEAVAELTLALILGILRNIGEAHYTLKNLRWEKKKLYGYELMGKRIAILGFGRIGRRLADLLLPFNTEIIAYDIVPIPKKYVDKGIIPAKNLEDAVEKADIITIHMPLTEETRDLINLTLMKKMKKKPFIINTARGGIIKFDDLKDALKLRLIKGVALDVYPNEPFEDKELLKYENIIVTPHIGAQTYEANMRAAEEVIKILKENL